MTKLSEINFNWGDVIKIVGIVMLFEATYSGIKDQFRDLKDEIKEVKAIVKSNSTQDSASRLYTNSELTQLKSKIEGYDNLIDANSRSLVNLESLVKEKCLKPKEYN